MAVTVATSTKLQLPSEETNQKKKKKSHFYILAGDAIASLGALC